MNARLTPAIRRNAADYGRRPYTYVLHQTAVCQDALRLALHAHTNLHALIAAPDSRSCAAETKATALALYNKADARRAIAHRSPETCRPPLPS